MSLLKAASPESELEHFHRIIKGFMAQSGDATPNEARGVSVYGDDFNKDQALYLVDVSKGGNRQSSRHFVDTSLLPDGKTLDD